MVAKTPAQRQADLKARRKVAGVVKITVWADREDVAAIREHAAKLARKRQRAYGSQERKALSMIG